MSNSNDNKELRCTFCGRPQSQVERLVAGPGVYICDECIYQCLDILKESDLDIKAEKPADPNKPLPKPRRKVLTLWLMVLPVRVTTRSVSN